MSKQTTFPPPELRGTKPFADSLRMLESGEFVEDAATALRDLNALLSEHAANNSKAKGKIVLTIDITHEKGLVVCTTDIAVKAPKMKRPPTALWLDEENNLSRSDPRQMEMNAGPRAVDRLREIGDDVRVVGGDTK